MDDIKYNNLLKYTVISMSTLQSKGQICYFKINISFCEDSFICIVGDTDVPPKLASDNGGI